MLSIALKMLMGDRAKYAGLLLGIAFTAFLVTFAAAYFSGFMTSGFALIAENSTADVWVMDPAVNSVEQTIAMPDSALDRVRSVTGVSSAVPLALGVVEVRFPNGRFQTFQVIGVDDATLTGAPLLQDGSAPAGLHASDAAIIDPGGTSGKLLTPSARADQWPIDGVHLEAPLRELARGDELLVNDARISVTGLSRTLPRFPPRPLMYMTYTNAARILPKERHLLTFVLAKSKSGVSAQTLAQRIEQQTGLRARSATEFKEDTVRWYLVNSEDVGDMAAMLILAMTVGFGGTGILLYMFSYENLKHYAVLNVMGATPHVLLTMVVVQAAVCALIGSGIGLGVCSLVGVLIAPLGFPFRMMWFAPLLGLVGVLLVSLTAAAMSVRTVLKLQPAVVFSGR